MLYSKQRACVQERPSLSGGPSFWKMSKIFIYFIKASIIAVTLRIRDCHLELEIRI